MVGLSVGTTAVVLIVSSELTLDSVYIRCSTGVLRPD